MYISFRRKVYRYCRKLLHFVSIGLIKGGPTPINAGKWYRCSWGQQSSFWAWQKGAVAVYHGQKAGKWKEICRRILLHWKKVVPLHHCKRRKRLCETFRGGKKGKGLIAQLV